MSGYIRELLHYRLLIFFYVKWLLKLYGEFFFMLSCIKIVQAKTIRRLFRFYILAFFLKPYFYLSVL